ncbi:MAG: hypothetical protein PHW53_02950 [Patescibacteria group bacterium]|nr:hypothetical protein [Patescibacteria group bacterium]
MNKNSVFFRKFLVFVFALATVMCGIFIADRMILAWTGPTGVPPANNTPGVIWNLPVTSSAQTAEFNISGSGKLSGDIYLTNNKAIRADAAGITTIWFGNWGAGATGFKLGVTDDIEALGTITATEYCLNGFCITAWPAPGGSGDITAVTAGTGLSGGGASGDVTLNADTTYLQRRVSGVCADGSSIRVINADGTVTCETDDSGVGGGGDITGVTAGAGLSGGGLTGDVALSIDYGQTQKRVNNPCPDGQAINYIGSDGSVFCVAVGVGTGDLTDVLAGGGINVTNSGGPQPSVAINPTYTQRRVSSSCAAGTSIRVINEDGTVSCQPDTNAGGDITGVTAGTGLTGGGVSGDVALSVDTAYLQRRVSGTCAAGNSIRTVNVDGTVACETDDVGTGDLTDLIADLGINIVSPEGPIPRISVNTSVIQKQVGGSCVAGQSIRQINTDGTVLCEVDDNAGGDITGVTAGTNLSGGGVSGDVTINVIDSPTFAGALGVNGQAMSATVGIQSQGTAAGGYFVDSNNTGTYAYLGFGTYGVQAVGTSIGVYGTGATYGGYFYDSTSLMSARLAYESYGLYTSGNVYIGGACTGGGTCDEDVAEYIDSYSGVEAGDVVEISSDGRARKSTQAYSTKVIGVISTNPAIIFPGGNEGDDKQANREPLALSGIVPVKVSTENGVIQAGDLLTSSNTPGHAMRCTDKVQCGGAIIGKALESFSGKAGTIKMIVTLQ